MTNRIIQFGSIKLTTNGIDIEIYKKFFDEDYIPMDGRSRTYLTELLKKTNEELEESLEDNEDSETIKLIQKCEKNKLTKKEVEKRNKKAEKMQIKQDPESYTESKGFFQDLSNVHEYTKNLTRGKLIDFGNNIFFQIYIQKQKEAFKLNLKKE